MNITKKQCEILQKLKDGFHIESSFKGVFIVKGVEREKIRISSAIALNKKNLIYCEKTGSSKAIYKITTTTADAKQ